MRGASRGAKHGVDLGPLRDRAQSAWRRSEAAASLTEAIWWAERAHRMAPADQNLAFSLALLRFRAGDAAGAVALFEQVARRHSVREAWAGLAAASLAAKNLPLAVEAATAALSGNAADAALRAVARDVARAAGLPGWCALSHDGILISSVAASIALDGRGLSIEPRPDGGLPLPEGWEQAARLTVEHGGDALLGSPIALDTIRSLEGFVDRDANGLFGWAWHKHSPEKDPVLRILDRSGHEIARLTATDLTDDVEGSTPLARPRRFSLAVPDSYGLRVIGADGHDLLGSPLPCRKAKKRVRASNRRAAAPSPAVDVVIPVYRGLRTTLDCIESVLATVAPPNRIWVVDDGSPDAALVAALRDLARQGRINLIPSSSGERRNLGFPSAANAGLRASAPHDAVLLNSDTLVAPHWLERLRQAATSASDIGTATPFSNEASIFSTPDPDGGNVRPDFSGTARMAALAARANDGVVVEVPTAHGFCMFIRRDCLAATGLFHDDIFAQGYGEENDFCERARALGWRHVAAPAVYVAHVGGVSFGGARDALLRRNLRLLGEMHPDYHATVARFIEADPLADARRRLDAARWAAARQPGQRAVLLVTHGGGGGTARIVAERVGALRGQDLRPITLTSHEGFCELGAGEDFFPNLRFDLPAEFAELAALLADDHPVAGELHHLLGHDHGVLGLFAHFGIPFDVVVHDYGMLCPRISLVTGEGFFCGEPEVTVCESCVARWGRAIEDPIAPTALRRRSASDLAAARAVIVPSEDVAQRVRRHFPGIAPSVRAWEIDPPHAAPTVHPWSHRVRVALAGALGVEKGFDVLLACAKNAAARDLPLDFVVVGYTIDDDALEATGRARITGPFAAGEAAALIRAEGAHLALLPSIWPETWCFALSDLWQAGLSAAVFDIGTPSLRVRASGRGWVLPLGLDPPRVNDALLNLAAASKIVS